MPSHIEEDIQWRMGRWMVMSKQMTKLGDGELYACRDATNFNTVKVVFPPFLDDLTR